MKKKGETEYLRRVEGEKRVVRGEGYKRKRHGP